jgi:hypothetical protein
MYNTLVYLWNHVLSMAIHKFGNVFTAEPPRTQRVDVLFYPAVRGGRIKGSLSASGRDLHKAFSLEEVETFVLAASHRQNKKPFSLRPLRLCGEQKIH